MKAIDKAISFAGGLTELSEQLGVTPQVIVNWRARGSVPADRCPDVEFVTNGLVRCEELNDSVRWEYIRGTARKIS